MNEARSTLSPQLYARAGGAMYLIIIVAGGLGEMFVRNGLVAAGDAAATAHNLMASSALWRIGVAGDLLQHVCDVGLAMALYVLLRPVNRNIALLALLFDLVAMSVFVANKLNLMLPMFLLGDAKYLEAFTPEQLQALSYVAVRAHGYGFGIGLIFFGCECIVLGWLIFRSGYLPKFLGMLMPIAGVCYLINSFALILAPKLADAMFPAILLPCLIAELSLCLWLLIKGVDLPKWNERMRAMPTSAA
jgi:hypothetical protein